MSFLRRRNHARGGPRTARQQAGDAAEAAACAHLVQAGCRILARNVRFREGELDVVADDGGTLVFVEVRMRRDDRFGGADGSVDRHKRQRLVRAAKRLSNSWTFVVTINGASQFSHARRERAVSLPAALSAWLWCSTIAAGPNTPASTSAVCSTMLV